MDIQRVDLERSARSSRLRTRVVLVLAELGTAHAGELATTARISTETLREIMHGAPPRYSTELAPVTLGLATVVPHDRVHVYAITEAGREWARRGRHLARRARVSASEIP